MSRIDDFETALDRLADVLQQPDSEYIRDAAIQRFEFCFELGWKTVQQTARHDGVDIASARAAIAFAWRNRWIDDEAAWLQLLRARNLTVHTYHQETADTVFKQLPYFEGLLRSLLTSLRHHDARS
jgi:nucleotidyltransferase substrate binding protein (TIGR01987 family)